MQFKYLRGKYMPLNVYELEREQKESTNKEKKSMKQATNNRKNYQTLQSVL